MKMRGRRPQKAHNCAFAIVYRARNCRLFGGQARRRPDTIFKRRLRTSSRGIRMDGSSLCQRTNFIGRICIPRLGDGPRLIKKGDVYTGQDLRIL